MAEKKPSSFGLIAAYVALFALLAAAAALGVYISNLNAQRDYVASLTPIPNPTNPAGAAYAYNGNMMQVTPDPAAPTRAPVLRTGSTGTQVVTLQTRLIELGYLTGQADGQFGPATEAAVIRFQQQHGLDADGKVGAATSELLYSDAARPMAATATLSPTATPAAQLTDTERLQARLKELGYYTGEVDGVSGPATRAAVRSFQQAHGLAADGIAGSKTNAVLYSDTAKPYTTPVPGSEPWVRADGLPLLVNADNPLPSGYQTSELVLMRSYCDDDLVTIKGSEIEGERAAVDALMLMLAAAHDDGLTVWQVSAGYRSVSYQQQLFDNQVYAYRQDGMTKSEAIARTRQTVADPGASEHHTGLAFDITVPGQQFSNTKQSVWLAQHCWEYGFIIRYPIDKTNITGISYEPWHVRYVGVEHAIRMRDENLCLEEYIEKYGN
ncbi:MAG: peptidoglycan-binding protein [Clostridia bacterium]|nr:peptidoglycan-binding protein [Clostridia bacterium]